MHCVEHLAGMNCVLPQINQIRDQFDEFVWNRACRCLHSITLASLTVLRTPASTNWSGWRRSKAGDRAPELARHGRQVAVAWHRRGCPAPCPPLSLTSLLPRQPHRNPQEPEPAVRASCWCTPSAAQACTERARSVPPCRARATPPHALSETLASPLLPRTRIVDVAHPTIASPPSRAAPKPYPSSNTSPAHWTRTAPS